MGASLRVRRRGFTMLELAVVTGAAAVLLLILVPAINSVRSTASRAQCTDNLQRLGLAFHLYLGDNSYTFPAPYVLEYNTSPPYNLNGYSWGLALLPYLGQGQLYSSYDVTMSAIDHNTPPLITNASAGNAAVIATPIGTFVCPAVPDAPASRVYHYDISGEADIELSAGASFTAPFPPNTLTYTCAPSDYTGVNGVLAECWAVNGNGFHESEDGIMREPNVRTAITEITDGLSTTILLAELAGKPFWYVNGTKVPVPGALTVLPYNNAALEGGGWGDPMLGENWMAGFTNLATCEANPTDIPSHNTCQPGTTVIGVTNQRFEGNALGGLFSFHPGGINVLMADGTVRFISSGISPTTLFQAITMHGHESVNLGP